MRKVKWAAAGLVVWIVASIVRAYMDDAARDSEDRLRGWGREVPIGVLRPTVETPL